MIALAGDSLSFLALKDEACRALGHAAIDGRGTDWPTQFDIEMAGPDYFRRAQTRTLRRLYELGVITIKGAA